MSLPLPARTVLRSPPGAESRPEVLSLFRALSSGPSSAAPAKEVIEAGIQSPFEPLRLLALHHLMNAWTSPAEQERQLSVLRGALQQAEEEADREDVAWTPILDELARTWEARRQSLPPAPQKERELEHLEERARACALWISTQTQEQSLEPLLAFQSKAFLSLLGREARTLSPLQAKQIALTAPEALFENPWLPDSVREKVARELWEESHSSLKLRLRESAPAPLLLAAGSARGLPASLQQEILACALEPSLTQEVQDSLLSILAGDRTLSEQTLTVLWRKGRQRTRALVLLNPSAPPLILEALESMDNPEDAERYASLALNKVESAPHLLTEDRLWLLLRLCRRTRPTLLKALALPLAVPEMWKWALKAHFPTGPDRRQLLRAAARHPLAKLDAELRRAILRDLPTAGELALLLPLTEPALYLEMILEMAQRDLSCALSILEESPPPPGTQVPTELVSRALESSDAETRLRGIRLAGTSSPSASRREQRESSRRSLS